MTRELLRAPTREVVFDKHGGKCVVCSYASGHGLRVHHVVPVSLGGKDELENLTLLCANCHSLVHHYSAKRFASRPLEDLVAKEPSELELTELKALIQAIHHARDLVDKNGGLVERPHTWEEALEAVARRNRYNSVKQQQFVAALSAVVRQIPPQVKQRCSFRLMRHEKYISINLMNYLLFRAPAHADMGGAPVYECFFSAPLDARLAHWAKAEGRDVFEFAYFRALNLGLSYRELLDLEADDWQAFADACLMALHARKQREWTSNIIFPESLRGQLTLQGSG